MRASRKLVRLRAIRMLYHAIEHLRGIVHDIDGEHEAIDSCFQVIRKLEGRQ
jgi:hypothetical protein